MKKKKVLALLLTLVMVLALIPQAVFAADGDETSTGPSHNKTRTSNGDGTYKLSLDVTGSSENDPIANKANVVVILDISGSMNFPANTSGRSTAGNNTIGRYGLNSDDYWRLYYSYGGSYYAEGTGPQASQRHGTVYYISNINNDGSPRYTQYNGTRYNFSNNDTRLEQAKVGVKALITTLLAQNSGKIDDMIEISFMTFSTNSHYVTPSSATGTGWVKGTSTESLHTTVDNVFAAGGTNWDESLYDAKRLADAKDDGDPTYIVFFSDGEPTVYNGSVTNQGGHSHSSTTSTGNANSRTAAYYEARQLNSDDYDFYGIFAYGDSDGQGYMRTLVSNANYGNGNQASGSVNNHYFSANNQDDIDAAFASIASSIANAVGVTEVSISDGTTNQVKSSSGEISKLLEVDEDSYEYWLSWQAPNGEFTMFVDGAEKDFTVAASGGNVTISWEGGSATYQGTISGNLVKIKWEDGTDFYKAAPPDAELKDGAVDWDLSSVGTLLNEVTYTVTFDVFPSEYTLDLIADLKNGDVEYSSLDESIRKYLTFEDGAAELETNTVASLTYSDTRTGEEGVTIYYNDLDPVPAQAQEMDLKKVWIGTYWNQNIGENGAYENESPMKMNLLRDGEKIDELDLTYDEDPEKSYTSSVFIATGILSVDETAKTVNVRVKGHDYKLEETGELPYHWELKADTLHPMLINNQLVMLKLVEGDDIPEGMGTDAFFNDNGTKYYKIGENVYTAFGSSSALTATNTRRSNLNLTKTVIGELAPEGAKFTYTMTVNSSGADGKGLDDPMHDDDYVWFSVGYQDEDDFVTVKDPDLATAEGIRWQLEDESIVTTKPSANFNGYFCVQSGKTITVTLQAGWNLRFTNILTGSTYEFTETEMPDGFDYKSITITPEEDESIKEELKPVIDDEAHKVNGTVVQGNAKYTAEFTNTYSYARAQVDVTKVLTIPEGLVGPGSIKEKYTFTLTPVGDAPMPKDKDGNVLESLTVKNPGDNGGKALFDEIIFPDPGTYQYTITESGTVTGVVNDTTNPRTATVVVTLDEDTQTMAVEVTGVTFTNVYAAKGAASFKATKKLEGKDLAADQFTFVLTPGSGAPMPVDETTGEPMTTVEVKNAADGTITFPAIEFTSPGPFTYTITEVNGGQKIDGISYDNLSITVTVTATDNGDGTMAVSVAYSDDTQFDNTYGVDPIEVPFAASKALEITNTNTYPDINGKYDLKIEAVSNTAGIEVADMPMPATATVQNITSTTNGTGTAVPFGNIKFTKAGTYVYKISEACNDTTITWIDDDSNAAGVNVTVVVTDNGDGTLSVEVSGNTSKTTLSGVEYYVVDFTNTYEPEPDSVELKALKNLTISNTDKYPDINGKYDLKIEAVSNTAGIALADMPMPSTTSVKNVTSTTDGKGTAVSFGEIEFTKPGTYVYKISETLNDSSITWIENDENASGKNVTVTVTDDGKGNLSATITAGSEVTEFTNSYTVQPTTASFPVVKNLVVPEGLDGPETWSYTINVAAANGAPEAETMTGTVTQDSMTANFGPFTYTAPGEYTYTVTESGNIKGVENDEAAASGKTVTVSVVDNGDGTLSATVKGADSTAETVVETTTFTNTYSVGTVKASIPVKKVVDVPAGLAGPKSWSYTVTVTPKDDKTPVVETMTGTVTDKAPTTSFGEFTYTVPGTYTYTVAESGTVDGITNGTASYTVTVEVEDNGDGTLSATVKSGDAVITAEAPLTFTNSYNVEPTKAQPVANKSLVGRQLKADEFSFTITPGTATYDDGTTGTAPGESESKKNNATGLVSFSEIEFAKPGTYTYTIKEEAGTLDRVDYDTKTVITATVTVVDKGDGTLEATIAYEGGKGDDKNIIVNTYTPDPTKANISVNKKLVPAEGTTRTLKAGDFTFTLVPVDGAPMPLGEDDKPLTELTATNDADGKVNFATIDTFAEEGTFQYKITEVKGNIGGVTYDTSEITVTVTVTYDDVEGKFIAEVGYPEDITFENPYVVEPVSITPETLKIFDPATGTTRKLKAGEFTFVLTETTEGATYTDTATNAADGTVVFKNIEYTKTGTYTYTITETKGTLGGVTYATNTVNVTVTVTDDGNGKLVAEVEYSNPNSFTNTYKVEPTTAVIDALKALEGRALEDKQFKFELKDANGQLIETATNDAGGKVTFAALTFEAAGSYEYTINEVIENKAGYTYDSTVIKATVTVVDKEDGTLEATVAYDPSAKTFTNIYKAKGSAQFEAGKELTGKELEAGEFSFELKDADGKVLQTRLNDAEGKISFDAINYTEADAGKTFTYTITEVDGGKNGYTYDDKTITVTVKVTDNGDGTLKTEVTYDDTEPFVNDFELIDISVTKVWDDADDQDGKRPDSVVVNLLADGEKTGKSVVLKEENKWTDIFTGLPKYDSKTDTLIKYTVEEDKVAEYKVAITGDVEKGFTVTNTHEVEKIKITVTKVWDDENNKYKVRPASVTAELYANGKKADSVVLNEDNKLTYTFEVDKYADGKEITYTVDEQKVTAGYTKKIEGDVEKGFTITNTFAPVWGDPPVGKEITGDDPATDETFTFKLAAISTTAEGLSGKMPMPEAAKGAQEMTMDIVGEGFEEFGEFPFVVPGVYTYTITEVKGSAEGYTYDETIYTIVYTVTANEETNALECVKTVNGVEITGNEKDDANLAKFTFTNTYTKPVVSVKVTKVWKDDNNNGDTRPTAVGVKLLANGKDSGKSIALSEANEWTYTFEDLDKYDENGKAIAYTVEETEVPENYKAEVAGDMEKGFVITNSLDVVKTGDTDDMRIYGTTMAASIVAMLYLALKKRKGGKHYSH